MLRRPWAYDGYNTSTYRAGARIGGWRVPLVFLVVIVRNFDNLIPIYR